jgi:hypothetical protein
MYFYKLNFGPLASESVSTKIQELRSQLNEGFPDYKHQVNLEPWLTDVWSKEGSGALIQLEKMSLPDGSYQVSVELVTSGGVSRW